MVGGPMPIPESARAMGARPAWMYVGVDDVDGYATRVKAARGTVTAPKTFRASAALRSSRIRRRGVHPVQRHERRGADSGGARDARPAGMNCAADREGAFVLLSFRRTKTEAMDMGPMIHQMFATGGPTVGGMMTKAPEMPVPCWLYYSASTPSTPGWRASPRPAARC
jgi:predicted enzyme related to lactoylglutathione lyase